MNVVSTEPKMKECFFPKKAILETVLILELEICSGDYRYILKRKILG